MSLAAGTRIGPYEIIGTLGAGGMGEVYRAKDTRLNRLVAVKAMHGAFAQDPERISRFEREAHLLASLNHPNIAAIHGVEEAEGSRYLVLEFVDGRPLSTILQHGAPPIGEALAIAGQIANALAAAHERGIIHRDLKPGDGQVKLLDFGLGKALESESSQAESATANAQSPTMTMAATQAGIILGTAGYMSPEQARGRVADKRSDVWAFGCVLYELLTGKRAFDGEDVTDVLAAIVRGEPEWSAVAATVPPHVRDLVKRCLIKNRSERLADMSVVQFVLSERVSVSTATAATQDKPSRRLPIVGIASVLVAAVLGTILVYVLWPSGSSAAPGSTGLAHLAIPLRAGDEMTFTEQAPVTISRDGSTIAFTAVRDGKGWLFVRRIDEREASLLPGTQNAKSPFFSPDGQWIGFFAQGRLKKITVGGTGLTDLAPASDARGGTWSPDNTIYFAPRNVSGLMKVPAAGGEASAVTQLDREKGDISHRWPQVVMESGTPRLLFAVWSGPGPDEHHIVQANIDGSERVRLSGGDTPRFLPPGYLAYGRLDSLFAVPWTPGQKDLSSRVPITLRESAQLENEGSVAYDVSSTGTLVYLPGSAARRAHRVVWIDRQNRIEPLPIPDSEFENVAISPDGKFAALQIEASSIIEIWLYDFERKSLVPLGKSAGSSQAPLWTADSKSIIYRGTRKGSRNLYRKSIDGTGTEERLTTKDNVIQTPTSISPDGDWVFFNEGGSGTSVIWRVQLSGEHKVESIFTQSEINGQISPDGKWIAFQSSSDLQSEVLVQAFPGPGPRQQVSVGGGGYPLWSRDGRELYYEAGDKLMAVSFAGSPALNISAPRVLMTGRFRPGINSNTQYSVAKDGRFLRIQRVQPELPVTQIEIVLNWFQSLGQK